MHNQYECGEILRILKIATNSSNEELAQAADCTPVYISTILSSKNRPSFLMLEHLLDFFGFSLYDFTTIGEYRNNLGADVSDLRKYQLTLLKILKTLEKNKKIDFEYGEIFRILRIANDISNEELAQGVDCTRAYIWAIMSSERRPGFLMLERLLDFLNFSLHDFTTIGVYRNNIGPDVSDLRKYQLTLLNILIILEEKDHLDSEGVRVL